MIDFFLIGIIAACFGVFYRSCLKMPDFIFHGFYAILDTWVWDETHYNFPDTPSWLVRFKAWIAYPLGYCVYCTTPWIGIILYFLYVGLDNLPSFRLILFELVIILGVSHVIVAIFTKYLLTSHPDLEADE